MTCPVCGTVTVPGARYCHSCGAALPAVSTLPAAERRVVTVLFGDLSDFTAWSEQVDPERVGAVTDRVLAALANSVQTFGGHVDKLTGDGIMAVFGAPVAHEDDPERAVRAALAMQRAVRRVLDDERGGGAPTGLRVGVNTGPVVAGVQAALDYTVVGDTVNTAARLADAAAVGSVYGGASTSAATRHVAAWRRLHPLRLKGKREAVEAYELLGPLDAPGTRSGLGDKAPLVGRETELALVSRRLAEVVERGEPHVLVFVGEAGLGKTRLAAEVERLVANRDQVGGARVLSVRAAPYGERWRLGPLADLVRAAAGLPEQPYLDRAEAEERLRRLAGSVRRRTGHSPRLRIESLLALLGRGEAPLTVEHAGGLDRLGLPHGPSAPEVMPAAVAELLAALAAELPLVIIVDDLDAASPPTVDALVAMLRQLHGPVLSVLLGRPDLSSALPTEAELHRLSPLRSGEATRLLSAYLGGGRLPAPDAQALHATAQGNPFYLAELVTLLVERGALTQVHEPPAPDTSRRDGATWRLAPGSLSGRLLSRDLAAVLAARIDALPAPARAVLRDAAVVGDTVPEAALAALGGASADARPAAVAAVDRAQAVDELLHRRMLLPARGGYAFATPLLREAAYSGVGKADLAERHARLAKWAAGLAAPPPSLGWTEDALDAFIAEHAERATKLADEVMLRPEASVRAVAALGVAALGRLARRAIRSGEPAQSERFARRGAELAGGTPPAPDRLVLASALLQLGRTAEALDEAEKVAADLDKGDDPESLARALLLIGRASHILGQADQAERAWAESLEVAEAAGLSAEQAEAYRRIGMQRYREGHLRTARAHFERALAIAEESRDQRAEAWALQNLAWVATSVGDFDTADRTLLRATRLFAALRDPGGRAWLRGTAAFTRLLAGRLTEARRLAGAFLAFGERVGERWAVGTLRAVGAYAAAELGDLPAAAAQAEHAYREFDEIDDDWGRGFSLVVRGAVARGYGDDLAAIDLLTQACTYGERTGHPMLLVLARTARGFAALATGDIDAAAADAQAVLATVSAPEAGAAVRVAPQVLLGLVRLARGDAEGAVRILHETAADDHAPSVLLPRRQAVAEYARALLAAGRTREAVAAAERAVALPGEDAHSRVLADQVLEQTRRAAAAAAPPA